MKLTIAIAAFAAIVAAEPIPNALFNAPPGGFVAPSDPCLIRHRTSQHVMPVAAEMNGFKPGIYDNCFSNCDSSSDSHHHHGCHNGCPVA